MSHYTNCLVRLVGDALKPEKISKLSTRWIILHTVHCHSEDLEASLCKSMRYSVLMNKAMSYCLVLDTDLLYKEGQKYNCMMIGVNTHLGDGVKGVSGS